MNFEVLGERVEFAGRFVGILILLSLISGPARAILEGALLRWGVLLPDWATLVGLVLLALVVTVVYGGSIDDFTVFCLLTVVVYALAGFALGSYPVESSWLALGRDLALLVGAGALAGAIAFRSDWRAVVRRRDSAEST